MKLLRHGPPGREKPGLLDASGGVRDLSALIDDIDARVLSPAGLQALAATDPERLPCVAGDPRLGAPVAGVGKFIGVGLNYRDHAAESGMAVPAEPILFSKATSCIAGPNDAIVLPVGSTKSDWEVELGVVIGIAARRIEVGDALRFVAGYCVVNDVSEREYQLERGGGQWDKGKGCDSFGPLGPWLVTADEVADPQSLDLWLDLNGERVQRGNTRTMIFGVAELVSYISRYMTLLPGDVIATGTPPGVGMGMKPPRFLRRGDELRLGIGGLGEQRQQVAAALPGD